jgi:hypothetical protein
MPVIIYKIHIYIFDELTNSVRSRLTDDIDILRRRIVENIFDYIPDEVRRDSEPYVNTYYLNNETMFSNFEIYLKFQNSPEYTRDYLFDYLARIPNTGVQLHGISITIRTDLVDIYENDNSIDNIDNNYNNRINHNNRNNNRNNNNNNRNNNNNNRNNNRNNILNIGNISINKDYEDPITQNYFNEGNDVIRLQKNNRFIFKPEGILRWVDNKGTNPLTRNRITTRNMEKGKAKIKGGKTRVSKTRVSKTYRHKLKRRRTHKLKK